MKFPDILVWIKFPDFFQGPYSQGKSGRNVGEVFVRKVREMSGNSISKLTKCQGILYQDPINVREFWQENDFFHFQSLIVYARFFVADTATYRGYQIMTNVNKNVRESSKFVREMSGKSQGI